MRIDNLTSGSGMYTSNVYLVRGDWNALEDINTLVDVGRDPAVLEKIEEMQTGLGKKRVEQVVLTHSHYDHVSMLQEVRRLYRPTVYAFSPHLAGVDRILRDGDRLLLGDCWFEIMHVPCHSQDSICLFNREQGVLFSGDTPVDSGKAVNGLCMELSDELGRLMSMPVRKVYPGHGSEYFMGGAG